MKLFETEGDSVNYTRVSMDTNKILKLFCKTNSLFSTYQIFSTGNDLT